jgi:hypothetical protein
VLHILGRVSDMGLFSTKPRACPLCSALMTRDRNEVIGHVLSHIDDAVPGRPSAGLKLSCGCRDAIWGVNENFPEEARIHLVRAHGMRD